MTLADEIEARKKEFATRTWNAVAVVAEGHHVAVKPVTLATSRPWVLSTQTTSSIVRLVIVCVPDLDSSGLECSSVPLRRHNEFA